MEKVDYLSLKTLADVKAARTRVGDRLNKVEARLKEDYNDVTRMFDFSYIAEAVARKMATIYGIIETVLSGYNLVSTFVSKFRDQRRRERGCDED